MGLFGRKTKSESATPNGTGPIRLAEAAVACLQRAVTVQLDNLDLLVEERVIWQPDSWLLQRIGQVLAEGGAGEAALAVAQMVEGRVPLARAHALYRVAQVATDPARGTQPSAVNLVRRELHLGRPLLFGPWTPGEEFRQVERLLLYGASAALIGEQALALACLERADQRERVWERVMITPEPRALLAQIVARVGLHPLTSQLIQLAIRRYEDSGAQFLHQVAMQIGPRLAREQLPRRVARLLQRCVDTFQFATLTTLTSRRYAAIVLGQAGLVHELLEQITTIANVQLARRESGLSSGKGDPHFLRQVKRPAANPDVDFQVYTLQEAIRAMPVRTVPRDQRKALADRLGELAMRSDGWTAAGAAASLIEVGAVRHAITVVDRIPPQDPTRSEGVLSLVRALLAEGDAELAEEQVRKAVTWVKSLDKRNPERATLWGLAELYLEHDQPDAALRLLEQRMAPPGMGERMRRAFQNRPTDDELRDNGLRLRARLRQGVTWDKEFSAFYAQVCQWAPRLLDGEVLMSFYLDGLLRPLLAAGEAARVWALLPQVAAALALSSGDKHTMQVQRVAKLLGEQAAGLAADDGAAPVPGGDPVAARQGLTQFLAGLWEMDVQKGLWQTIHGIEGSLSLMLVLEGADALVTLAQVAVREGSAWVVVQPAG